jgi:predicted RNase H-like HicB family nuclease
MKEITVKAKRKFTVVMERDEDENYLASFPALHGCHPHARTFNSNTLMKRARDVVDLYLESGEEVDDSLEFVGIHQISV